MFELRLAIPWRPEETRIAVGAGLLDNAGELIRRCVQPHRTLLLTDRRVAELHGPRVQASLAGAGLPASQHTVEVGETAKSLAAAAEIYARLGEDEVGRDGLVLALGGGVVSDLGGFVAGTWMRGVAFAICPTTLEADVDAAIGGKTAVNVPGAKNLVGVFHQPKLVLIDPLCLTTLPERDVRAGLAESVKHALLEGEDFLAWHEHHVEAILAVEMDILTELIQRNVRLKADMVTRDPYELAGTRMLLNLGHTVGHAIEEACAFERRHGECVALGLVATCRLSQQRGLLDSAVTQRVTELLARLGLPTRLAAPLPTATVLDIVRRDKKSRAGSVRFVLLRGLGQPVVCADVTESEVAAAYESLRS
ncbi:MAG TPA: 3-dehydroquinate synthase [Phycisphaerae bacterium]|nr:3-dehydroquinate synthase [Phycisphaerae bacterium]HNU44039.1 3-dehydroquinate synthase [Phycisphaerae bacterium]